MVRIEDNGRNHEAQKQCAHHGGQRTGRAAAQPHHVDPYQSVADAVAERAHEEHLFGGKDGKVCPGVATKGEVADQQGNAPINDYRHNAPAGPCDGAWTGLRQAEALPRVP